MMIHPDGLAVFVEVPKTGSTAATLHLRNAGKWFQNGSKGHNQLPGTYTGRHAAIEDETKAFLDEHDVVSYGVVRNPWDRMASMWRASAPGSTRFIEYLKTGKFIHGPYDLLHKPQREWLRHVTHVIRYEDLERTWDQLHYQFGHLPLGPIPQKNVSKNRAVPEWTREELDIVEKRFLVDAEHFGYTGPS